MKLKRTALFLVASTLFAACTASPSVSPSVNEVPMESDFTPPQGLDPEAPDVTPGARRILSASSDDGIHWTKTNQVISDQADVPDLVVDDEGTLYMYYYGWEMGEKMNDPAVAISKDQGQTWVYKYVTLEGAKDPKFADPDVEFVDGLFYLYGSQHTADGYIHIVSATSTDGLTFTYQGVALDVPDESAGVSSTFLIGDVFYKLSLDVAPHTTQPGRHWIAMSRDGLSFDLIGSTFFRLGQHSYFIGNVVDDPIGDGVRLYAFSEGGSPLRSWTSEDGVNWTSDDAFSLEMSGPLESGFIGEPDVIQLPDGSYFMTYTTLIPH